MSIRIDGDSVFINNEKFNIQTNADLNNPEMKKKILKIVSILANQIDDIENSNKIDIHKISDKVNVKKIDLKDIETNYIFKLNTRGLKKISTPPRFVDFDVAKSCFKEDTLKRTYKINTNEVGFQECKRIPIIFNDIDYVENELKRTDLDQEEKDFLINQKLSLYAFLEQGYRNQLQNSLDDLSPDTRRDAEKLLKSSDIFTLKSEDQTIDLDRYMNDLKTFCIKNNTQSWLGASYTRTSLLKVHGHKEGWKRYISAPINARWHTVSVDRNSHDILRVGVFSDMRNGFVSLKTLIEIQNSTNPEERLEALKEELLTKTRSKKELKTYFLNQLTVTNLNSLIEDRTRYLTKQMGHLIANQIEHHPHLIQNGEFNLLHLSFLRDNRHEIDGRGWIIDEKTEMEDMAEIFHIFNDKKIFFDLENGPFSIKDDGIHLPKKEQRPPIQLKTHFINISVQGNTTNTTAQQTLNEEALESLKNVISQESLNLLKERLQEINNLLIQGDEAYTLVRDFIKTLLDSKSLALSIGCLSAKDRTGQVIEDIFQLLLNNALKGQKNPFEEDDAFQTRIAQESAEGQTGLKVHPQQALGKHKFIKSVSHLSTSFINQQLGLTAPLACDAISENSVTLP